MKNYKFTLISMVLCLIAFPASAEQYGRTLEMINQLNEIKPLQNPGYESADEVLKRRVLDQKNKVVGDVKDVILKDNGSISHLQIDFNRLRLGSEVYVNYRDLNARPSTNGYMFGFSGDQIKTLYPTFLADMETASGENDESFSLRKVLGSQVVADDGRKLGVVEDVLFSSDGSRAEAYYITMQINPVRGHTIAVPIGMGRLESGMVFGRRLVIGDNEADAMIDYAEENN